MSLVLTKSNLPLDASVGTASAQIVCKATVQVPEGKPDIGRILAPRAEAKVDASSVRVADGNVTASGIVRLDVPYIASYDKSEYTADKEPIRFFTSEDASFSAQLPVAGAQAGMPAFVEAEVDSFEADVVGPRAVTLTAIVKVAAKVTSQAVAEFVSDVADVEANQLELTKRTFFVESKVGKGSTQVTIRDAFQVPEGNPDISEIVDYTASVLVGPDGMRPTAGKANVTGTLDMRIVYAGDADVPLVVFLAGPQIDFSSAIDMPGLTESARLKGTGSLVSLSLTKLGSRTMQVEAVAAIDVEGTVVNETTALTDIASKDAGQIDMQKAQVTLESLVGQVSGPVAVAETFAVGADKANVDEVLMSFAKARIIDAKIAPDKVVLSGEVDVFVTYVGQADEEGSVAPVEVAPQLGLPFELSLDVSGVESGMGLVASCDVLEVEAVKAGPRAIDVDVKLAASLRVTEDVTLDVVTDAAMVEAAPPADAIPSRRLTIYVVQQGDTMWKIARRYSKAMAAIMEANALTSNEVYPGMKLLIPA